MPFAGETLPLSLQLYDFNTGKFTRVHLADQDGTVLPGSPFNLTHIGNGKYTSDAVVMPTGVDYIEATYEVFASAADRTAGTPLDPDYTSATDVYRFEIPDSVLDAKLDQILDKLCNIIIPKLDGFALPGASIKVQIDPSEVEAIIDDVNEAKAILNRDPSVTAKIKSDPKIIAELDDDEVDAKTKC